MGVKVTFDPTNKLILVDKVVPDASGAIQLDFKQDIYSDGKEDWLSDTTLNKLKFPIRAVGGDDISSERKLGSTFFLQYGWRIRPYEGDHRFILVGNLYTDPFGDYTIVPTSGAFNVLAENQVSNLTDASIARLDITNLKNSIESLRKNHLSFGNEYYWDPVNGLDGNDGLTPDTPKKTFAATYALCQEHKGDVIYAISADDETTTTEKIRLDKHYVYLRGQGKSFTMSASDATPHPSSSRPDYPSMIEIVGDGIEVSGIQIKGYSGSAPLGILMLGDDNSYIHDCYISSCSYGIGISGSTNTFIESNLIQNNHYDAILCGARFDNFTIKDNRLVDNGRHGIYVTSSAESHGLYIEDNVILYNQGYGMYFEGVVTNANVRGDNYYNNNVLGQIGFDTASFNTNNLTLEDKELNRLTFQGRVYVETDGVEGTEFPIGNQSNPVDNLYDGFTISNDNNLETIAFGPGTFTITPDMSVYGENGVELADLTFTRQAGGRIVLINTGCPMEHCHFQDLNIAGNFATGSDATHTFFSVVAGIPDIIGTTFYQGIIKDSAIVNDITFASSSAQAFLIQYCTNQKRQGQPVVMNLGDRKVNVRGWDGDIQFAGATGGYTSSLSMYSGKVTIDSTCVSGALYVQGTYDEIIDNSGPGFLVMSSSEIDDIASAVWDEQLSLHSTPGSAGDSLANVSAGANPSDIASAVWNDTASLYTTTSSFGYAVQNNLKLILGLVQHNFRMTNQVYDANGNMTSALVSIYPSTADANAETNAINSYTVTAVYDASNRLTDYKMVE